MRIGIFGASGQAGRRIAKALVAAKTGDVVLLGRNEGKLKALKETLAPCAVEAVAVEAGDEAGLEKACAGLDLLVVAISSQETLPAVVRAVLKTKTDCLDILLDGAAKRACLDAHRADFERLGICYITDGGYHPGVPGAMVRWAQEKCPGLRSADVFGAFGIDWSKYDFAEETALDFVRELTGMDMGVLRDGAWVSGWQNTKRHDFADGRGMRDCVAMGLDEMRLLPGSVSTLKTAGFYIAGFGFVVDWIFLPLVLAMRRFFPEAERTAAKFLMRGLKTFAGKEEYAKLDLVGYGETASIRIGVSYPDAYELTALPVIACIKQYADGLRRPGLRLQALAVEPQRFWEDLEAMGVTVTVSA